MNKKFVYQVGNNKKPISERIRENKETCLLFDSDVLYKEN